jgi:hypothetical protein
MISLGDIRDAPWSRYQWSGEFISADGAPIDDFVLNDVSELIAYGETDDHWDGESAGVVRLKDGRVVAWESSYGPTGTGFCCDAYGGDADIVVAHTVEAALSRISERCRELLVWSTP